MDTTLQFYQCSEIRSILILCSFLYFINLREKGDTFENGFFFIYKKFCFFLCVCEFCLHIYLSATCVPGIQGKGWIPELRVIDNYEPLSE